ncbi:MAG: long-chain fatty acid--CoA ligase [Spirochaetes bacterium]|nr:MAG: long-chain fatty acid--CoA ligase [Spirochaetota bacterium]
MKYELEKPDNLVEFIEYGVKHYSDLPLFGTKNTQGVYEWVTYGEVGRRVDNLRGGLAKLGIGKGDAVGIIANNRTEWPIVAFAAYGVGGRYVPMYEAELVKIWQYIIADSGVKLLFVSKPEIYEKVKHFTKEIPTLKHIYIIEAEGENSMAALEKLGEANPVQAYRPVPDEIAVLIYTSGTTGDPKGVLLSHGNISSNSHAGRKAYPELGKGDVTLSILPWAHSYGQTAELYSVIYFGGSIGFMESTATLGDDIAKVRPTFLIAVPRVFNKIYDGIWTRMNHEGGLKKALFVMAVNAGKKRRALAERGTSSFFTNLKFRIGDKLVFSKIRERFGGRLKGAMTASAAMTVDIAHFFFDVGIPCYDCYGMSETSPAATMNASYAYKIGSVGKAIEKVRIVIDKSVVEEGASDGEIIIYGPNVMKGYHNKPDQTKEILTPDGGVRTGDRGRLDDDGFLYITGRIKEQFKLENGKFVFPASMEQDIQLNQFVENVMVYGENRRNTIGLIVPDFVVLERWAKEKGMTGTPQEIIGKKEVQDMISSEIVASLKGKYGGYEIPKRFVYIPENFTLDNGMLTQTMKLKRRVVVQKYADLIEAAYKG